MKQLQTRLDGLPVSRYSREQQKRAVREWIAQQERDHSQRRHQQLRQRQQEMWEQAAASARLLRAVENNNSRQQIRMQQLEIGLSEGRQQAERSLFERSEVLSRPWLLSDPRPVSVLLRTVGLLGVGSTGLLCLLLLPLTALLFGVALLFPALQLLLHVAAGWPLPTIALFLTLCNLGCLLGLLLLCPYVHSFQSLRLDMVKVQGVFPEAFYCAETVQQLRRRHEKQCQALLQPVRPPESQALDTHECTVCLGPFHSSDNVLTLPSCGHTFHEACMLQWLAINASCPNCRCPVGQLAQQSDSTADDMSVELMRTDLA